MTHYEGLLAQIESFKAEGLWGERLEIALEEILPSRECSAVDTLRMLYVASASRRPLTRWALNQMDAEVQEIEEVDVLEGVVVYSRRRSMYSIAS